MRRGLSRGCADGEGHRWSSKPAPQALGYRELFAHLAGDTTLDEALELAVTRTRQFARRQRRWFARDPRITWLDIDDDPLVALDALDARAAALWGHR